MATTAIRIGSIRFSAQDSTLNAATSAPTAATNGTAIPDAYRGERAHFRATKTNTANFAIWGYDSDTHWSRLDTFQLGGTVNEVEQLVGISGYVRVYVQTTGCGVTALGLNTAIGFTEG